MRFPGARFLTTTGRLLLLALIATVGTVRAEPGQALVAKGLSAISSQRIQATLDLLASDTMGGRLAGSDEGRDAARWLANQLDELGLAAPPAGRLQAFSDMQNVLGVIPGQPGSREIVIAAHYDHLGVRNGQPYNGADDNASGCAALLEVIRAFIASGLQPERTVVFAFFDGEEAGKLGSNHYISRLDTPYLIARYEPPVFMLNFDMVGRVRDDRLQARGFRTSPLLWHWVDRAREYAPRLNIRPYDLPRLNGDHSPFMAYGVPVLHLHSGDHEDYHGPGDDIEKLNVTGITDTARLGFAIAFAAATSGEDLSVYINPHTSYARGAALWTDTPNSPDYDRR